MCKTDMKSAWTFIKQTKPFPLLNDWREAGCFFDIQIRAPRDKNGTVIAINLNAFVLRRWKRDEFCGRSIHIKRTYKFGRVVLVHVMVHECLPCCNSWDVVFSWMDSSCDKWYAFSHLYISNTELILRRGLRR